MEILNSKESWEEGELRREMANRVHDLMPKHIHPDDIMASLNYMICLYHGVGRTDDIDHLGNRRLRCVGELLQNQIRVGLSRLERVVRERMSIQDMDVATPAILSISVRCLRPSKEFSEAAS